MSKPKAECQQVPTVVTTTQWIMTGEQWGGQSCFACGVLDQRSGRGFRREYETASTNAQWCYERGRDWAVIVGPSVPLFEKGSLSAKAVTWFNRVGKDIL